MNISGLGSTNYWAQSIAKNKQSLIQEVAATAKPEAVDPAKAAAKTDSGSLASVDATEQSAAAKFLEFMKKTPEQQAQEAWLARHGITKEEFEKMSPEEKSALVAQMTQEMKEELRQKAEGYKPTDIVA